MTLIERLAAVSLAISLSAQGAMAADLPAPRAELFVPAFTWTGLYAGVQAGYSWNSDQTKEFYTDGGAYSGVTFKYNPSGAFAGGHVGYNYQIGSIVLGVEGDGEAVDARGGFNDPGGRSPQDPGGVGRTKREWQASVRGRLGLAYDRLLVFATGGAAFTEFDYFFYNPVARFGEGTRQGRTGWTAGVGVSYAFTDSIIGTLEYRHTDFGRFNYVATTAFRGLTGQQSPTGDSVRAMVSYKF